MPAQMTLRMSAWIFWGRTNYQAYLDWLEFLERQQTQSGRFKTKKGYSAGSPSCNEYSLLKLRPGGPMALRTPDQSDGIPGLTYDQQLKVQSSASMLSRVVTCLILTYLSGGHSHVEQPANAMSWLEPEVQSYISNVGVHCIMIAACAYNMDVDKAWIFSTSLASLQTLGTTCSHPKGTINQSSVPSILMDLSEVEIQPSPRRIKASNCPIFCRRCGILFFVNFRISGVKKP